MRVCLREPNGQAETVSVGSCHPPSLFLFVVLSGEGKSVRTGWSCKTGSSRRAYPRPHLIATDQASVLGPLNPFIFSVIPLLFLSRPMVSQHIQPPDHPPLLSAVYGYLPLLWAS